LLTLERNVYSVLADTILVVHFAFVAFVVIGFLLILIGLLESWTWIHNRNFRIAHLSAILIVVMQAWFGHLCPLTIWESELRGRAGESGYSESFIAHWLHKILFFDAASWVYTAIYTIFGALVLIFWFLGRRDTQ
jgi:polyferredoxin